MKGIVTKKASVSLGSQVLDLTIKQVVNDSTSRSTYFVEYGNVVVGSIHAGERNHCFWSFTYKNTSGLNIVAEGLESSATKSFTRICYLLRVALHPV